MPIRCSIEVEPSVETEPPIWETSPEAEDSEDSDAEDSEVEDSEVEDSEVEDSEAEDSEEPLVVSPPQAVSADTARSAAAAIARIFFAFISDLSFQVFVFFPVYGHQYRSGL